MKVYYQKCPSCGATWSAQLSEADVIRLGKETYTCKCNKRWSTGQVEWAHLSPEKRREYFFSTAEIGVLVLCVGIPPLFAWFIAIHPAVAALKAAAYGL